MRRQRRQAPEFQTKPSAASTTGHTRSVQTTFSTECLISPAPFLQPTCIIYVSASRLDDSIALLYYQSILIFQIILRSFNHGCCPEQWALPSQVLEGVHHPKEAFREGSSRPGAEAHRRVRSEEQARGEHVGKEAGSFHIHRKTMKDLWILAVIGVREQPHNLSFP